MTQKNCIQAFHIISSKKKLVGNDILLCKNCIYPSENVFHCSRNYTQKNDLDKMHEICNRNSNPVPTLHIKQTDRMLASGRTNCGLLSSTKLTGGKLTSRMQTNTSIGTNTHSLNDFQNRSQFLSSQARLYAKKATTIPSISSLSKDSFIIKNVTVDELNKQDKDTVHSNSHSEKQVSTTSARLKNSKGMTKIQSNQIDGINDLNMDYNEDLNVLDSLDENSATTLHYEKMVENKIRVDHPIIVQAHRVPEVIDIMEGKVPCPGCGAILQTKKEDKLGFIHPKALKTYVEQEKEYRDISSILKNKNASTMISKSQLRVLESFTKKKHNLTCQRCHNLSHYKVVHDVEMEDYSNKLRGLKMKDVLVIYIVDIFDLENSFIENLRELIGDKDIIVAVNKVDLIPSNTDEAQLENRIRKAVKPHLSLSDNNANPVKDVILLSAWSKWNFKKLGNAIDKHRQFRDVYIVGKTNVGKSTLTNSLVKYFGGSMVESNPNTNETVERPSARVTESELPGTTLNTVSLFIGSNKNGLKQRLLDTPGLRNDNLLISHLSPEEWKYVYPRKRIVPRFVAVSPGQSLFIGGLIRIDFVSNDVYREEFKKITMVVYTSNLMPIHLTKTSKADELFEKHRGTFLYPPSKENTSLTLDSSIVFKFQSDTRKDNALDITLPGFGWISANGAGDIQLKVHHPSALRIREREPLLPHACRGVSPRSYVSDEDFNRYKMRVNDQQKKLMKKYARNNEMH